MPRQSTEFELSPKLRRKIADAVIKAVCSEIRGIISEVTAAAKEAAEKAAAATVPPPLIDPPQHTLDTLKGWPAVSPYVEPVIVTDDDGEFEPPVGPIYSNME